MTTGPVQAILDAQHRDGYWVKPGSGYAPKYTGTVWSVIFLAQLGADGDDARVRAACEKLTIDPDLFIFDGQGTAHPRRMGIACHVGVLLDKPAPVARSRGSAGNTPICHHRLARGYR